MELEGESAACLKYIKDHDTKNRTKHETHWQVKKIFSELYIWCNCRSSDHDRVPTTDGNLEINGNTHMIWHVVLPNNNKHIYTVDPAINSIN